MAISGFALSGGARGINLMQSRSKLIYARALPDNKKYMYDITIMTFSVLYSTQAAIWANILGFFGIFATGWLYGFFLSFIPFSQKNPIRHD